jgi:CMP-N-acetylneuraminic acid synthetase
MNHVMQPRFFALVPVCHGRGIKASWRFMGKSLLACALDSILENPLIQRTFVVADEHSKALEELPDKGVERILLRNVDDTAEGDFPCSYPALRHMVDEIGPIGNSGKDYDGLVVLDILCPLRSRRHVQNAIAAYMMDAEKDRPWLSVFSVSLVQSHYHPKKVLEMTAQGELSYYDPQGGHIYRRQQLEDEAYFYVNKAVIIVDPQGIGDTFFMEREIKGCITNDPMVRVEHSSDLDFARAICERAEISEARI